MSTVDELLMTLTQRVRCLTVGQIARFWPQLAAGDKLASLQRCGVITQSRVLARPVLELETPLIVWRPKVATPNFGAAAYRLKGRWIAHVCPTDIVMATPSARRRYGGSLGGRAPRASEISHDVNLAEVFLRFRANRPDEAAAWVPEARLYAEGWGRRHRTRLPDAVIRSGNRVELAVEFGGAYSKQKLVTFHREMSEIPYEIW